jgi:hypothetical protein
VVLGGTGLALETDLILGRGQPGLLGLLLSALCLLAVLALLGIGLRLLLARGGVGLLLGGFAIALGLLLALGGRDLVLQPLALEFGLGPLLRHIGLSALARRLGATALRLDLGVGLGLLDSALAGELLVTGGRSERFFGLPHHLADDSAGSPFFTHCFSLPISL